jgi:hypothetical protein
MVYYDVGSYMFLSQFHFVAFRVLAFPDGSVPARIVFAGGAELFPDSPSAAAFGAFGGYYRNTILRADNRSQVMEKSNIILEIASLVRHTSSWLSWTTIAVVSYPLAVFTFYNAATIPTGMVYPRSEILS